MKISTVCAKHYHPLFGTPKLTPIEGGDEDTWEVDLSDMSCPEEGELRSCQEYYVALLVDC